MDAPIVARRIGELKIWVIADQDRYRLLTQILDRGFDFERAAAQTVRHLDRVGEGELFHPSGKTPEFEPAGDGCRRLPHDLPSGGEGEQSMDRQAICVVAQVFERGIQLVSCAVDPIRFAVEPIRPGREQRDSVQVARAAAPEDFVAADDHRASALP